MYVICAGMDGVCSTWPYEAVAHLLETHWKGLRLGSMSGEAFAAFDEIWADRPRWCVLKAHEDDPRFAASVVEGRTIAVHVDRDIRDVVFSLMRKRRVAFETLVRQGMIHRILANDRFWSSLPGVLRLRHEALIADPAAGVEQLVAHLGLPLAPGEAAEVAHEVDRRRPSPASPIRDEAPGAWRVQATRRQRAILARICDPWLVAHGYTPDTRTSREDGRSPLPRRSYERVRAELELARSWLAYRLFPVVYERSFEDLTHSQIRFDASEEGRRPHRPHDAPRLNPVSQRRADHA
jgi:hypothetical protein